MGDYMGASRNLIALASIKFRAKELELKGLNMRTDEGQHVTFAVNNYREPYQVEVAKNQELTERVVPSKDRLRRYRARIGHDRRGSH